MGTEPVIWVYCPCNIIIYWVAEILICLFAFMSTEKRAKSKKQEAKRKAAANTNYRTDSERAHTL
jgi:hypothetical protein